MPRAKRNARKQTTPRSWRRLLLPTGIALGCSAAIVFAVLSRARPEEGSALAAFPAAPQPPNDSVHFADFIGSQGCAGCHAAQFSTWSHSTHARAGQAPPADLLLRRFDGTPIRFRDATVEPRTSGSTYEFVVKWAERSDRYPIVGVVGAAHMMGGGTQGFLWRHQDGSLRLLPFEITGADSTWFCSTGTRANRGWQKITVSMSIADCGDWPPVRVLGSSARYASCQECHGSQIEMGVAERPYETRLKSLAINCESCHGPGRRHVQVMRNEPRAADIGMTPLATRARDASVAVCLRCHAVKVDVRRGYLPGRPFEERYSLAFPLLGGDETHVDGRTRTFAYQQGHLYSDCYLSGSMTCVDCHEPHGQQYRDINGRVLNGRLDDAQCLDCHPAKAEQREQHTRHKPDSPGSRCVSCHMPFLQQSAVGNQIRYTRSDHTISIPRPEVDQRLGVVNACKTCHQDRSGEELAADTRRFWGQLKPLRPIVADLIVGERLEDLQRILLSSDTTHRLAYFDALSRYFSRLTAVDARAMPRLLGARLWQLTESRNDDHAALALALLHLDGGREPGTRARLSERLRALGARDLSVRRRWAIALGHRGDALREQGRGTDAIALYSKALELLPDDPDFLMAIGVARLETGDLAGASQTLARVVEIDSGNSLAHINYGRARAAAGDAQGAHAAYRRATEVNPYDAIAYFNLGNALIREQRLEEAVTAYRKATELEVSLAPAHFNLARALLLQGQKAPALAAIKSGLIFDPNQPDASATAAQLEAELGIKPR